MPQPPRSHPFAAALLAPLFATQLAAQDPPVPPGGFPVHLDADQPITYSDGYRTFLDVRYPVAAAPATGWPCAMVVHGGGGSRKRAWVQAIADRLTRNGYLTLAYDTGNNGATRTLNPPGRRIDPERLTDLAEIFDFAETAYGAKLDESRLAVMGKSGGGKHALLAAAYSGRPLLLPGNVTHMPVISAIHTDIQVLDAPSDTLWRGELIKADWAVSAFENEGPTGPLSSLMIAHDYAGLAATMAGDPTADLLPLLQQTAVPLLVSYAYDDSKHFVNVNADAMATLPATLPTRYVQITGGHASAGNQGATTVRRDFTERWFDRFLKNEANGVDVEPFAEVSVLPAVPSDYLAPATDWQHRQTDVWPVLPSRRFYLRTGEQLDATPPAGIEAGPTIQHRVQAGYGMLQFMQHRARPVDVLPRIPLVRSSFDTAPLPAPAELFGRSIVELDIHVNVTDCQLTAALYDVTPGNQERFVTSGAGALRQVAPGRHRLRIELGDVGYLFDAGHRLRLSLENINLKRQPGNVHFYAVPDFTDANLTVQIDPTFAPRLDVPLTPVTVGLTPRLEQVSATGGFGHALTVEGGSDRAGDLYLLVAGGSGTVPGMTVGGTPVPVTSDVFTAIAMGGVNNQFFPGFLGTLDAAGRATGGIQIPPVAAPLIVGLRLSFAGVVIDSGGAVTATPPAELVIQP
ncbi:MAG: hypothetical protein NXI31_20675 [bacterium]|nr:hypothetical protein [bacterium]